MTRRLTARSGVTRYLVVLCHGVGSNADDLIGLAPHWAGFAPDAEFVSPDAPEPYDMAPPGFGRQWFSLADRDPVLMAEGVRRAAIWLDAFIDAELARLGLTGDACALMGFSQGAMTVLFAGLLAPETLQSELTGRPPVLIVHGIADPQVPVAWSQNTAEVLKAAGIPVQTLFQPGLGHSIDQAGILAGGQALRRALV
jgi:phospholipase/carboxylesterase